MAKTGRNDPCPCGSGKKYKRCCLAGPGAGAGYTRDERRSARAEMEEFTSREEWDSTVAEAIRLFCGPFFERVDEAVELGLTEQIEEPFQSWLWFDYRLPDGARFVDRFLSRILPSQGERRYLEQVRLLATRLYEIDAVVAGASLTLHDMVCGGRTTVRELLGSRSLQRWDVIAARVVPVGASGRPEIEDLIPMPRHGAQELAERLRTDLAAWRESHPRAGELEFFEARTPELHQMWLQAHLAPAFPTMMMPDGEEALLTTVRFEVRDEEALVAALERARDMEHDGDEQLWHWRPRRREGKEPPVSLTLRGDTLMLEAFTRGSARRAQARIERLAGEAVRAGLTSHQDLGQATRERRHEPPPPREEASPGADELLLEHYERHYRGWIEEPVPALDGLTPREAARSELLRPVLVATLKELEHAYCRSLAQGQVAYDASWMWEELGLPEAPEAPPRHRQPPLGHETLVRHLPGLEELARQLAERRRRRPDFDVETVITREDLEDDLAVNRFLREQAEQAHAGGLSTQDAATQAALVGSHLEILCNFELHHRKTFWIEEGLAWMLGRTNLDVVGDALRPPFASFALVFTDRDTLGLAERLLSKQTECTHRGRLLTTLSVYATEIRLGEGRGLRLAFLFDDLSADWPYLLARDLNIEADAHLEALLESHAPDVDPDSRDPVFTDALFKSLVQRSLNAILYATSAGAKADEPRLHGPVRRRHTAAEPGPEGENVYFLPGHIDIRELRQLQRVERLPGGRSLSHRFLVRGHWRRPNPSWKEQHLRWIRPYWKGPDIATVIERSYRLRPPADPDATS